MKTTEIPNIVSYVLALFDTLVLLVAWPLGKKGCKGSKWTKISLKDMTDPAYREKLAQGNIGVVQGEASGGIASIDIDDDAGADEFLALNPDLKETLRTRGARGFNVWFYPQGNVPRTCNLMREGQPWGEWRYNGRQTIIAGMHPSGVPYTILNATKAIRYPFERIKFPAGVTAKFIHPTNDSKTLTKVQTLTDNQQTNRPQSVVLCSTLCPSVSSKGSGLFDQETLEALLAGTIPTQRHQNHSRLFSLARSVKAFELALPAPLSRAHLKAVFSAW